MTVNKYELKTRWERRSPTCRSGKYETWFLAKQNDVRVRGGYRTTLFQLIKQKTKEVSGRLYHTDSFRSRTEMFTDERQKKEYRNFTLAFVTAIPYERKQQLRVCRHLGNFLETTLR